MVIERKKKGLAVADDKDIGVSQLIIWCNSQCSSCMPASAWQHEMHA
jgi:hypothetical protein